MEINELTRNIIGYAIKIHKRLGPGLLESTYETCLQYELTKAGFCVQQQLALPLIYDNLQMEIGYRIDLLVENKVIIEIKSVEALRDVHSSQVLTYLKLSNAEIGLLINFNESKLIDGLKRFIAKKQSY
ncbi:MAG: GxxExxY protein [Chitinophagaceae bacterium]